MSHFRYEYFIVTFLKLTICDCYTVSIYDLSNLNEKGKPTFVEAIGNPAEFPAEKDRDALRIMDGTRVSEIRRRNIFEDFVNAMFDLLAGFPERKLSRYFRVIYRTLDELDYKYTSKLAKYFRRLSRMERDEAKDELLERQNELRNRRPQLKIFIEAMNDIYTMEQGIKFRDYVFDVRDYANSAKREIIDETSSVFKTIINPINKLSPRELIKLEQKLRRAVREHDNDSN